MVAARSVPSALVCLLTVANVTVRLPAMLESLSTRRRMPECAAIEFEESRTRVFHALDPHSPFKTSAYTIAREISRFGVTMSARRVKSIIYREIDRLWHDEVETIRAWSEARVARQSSRDAV